jgi:hypothetical protein
VRGGTTAKGRPTPAGDARRAGSQRHGVLALGLNRVADSAFEFEFLQIFEYNSTKL